MRAACTLPRPKALLRLVLSTTAVLAVTLAMPRAAQAVPPTCATACTGTTGVGKNCTVMVGCPPFGVMSFTSETVFAAVSAGCTLGALDGMATAMHTPGQGVPATCSFSFGLICCGSPFCGPGTPGTIVCTVDGSDGLPIELMEFSVENGDEANADDEKTEDRDQEEEDG